MNKFLVGLLLSLGIMGGANAQIWGGNSSGGTPLVDTILGSTAVSSGLGTDLIPIANASRSTTSSYVLSLASAGAYITNNATTARLSSTGYGATNSALLIGGINAGLGLVGSSLLVQAPASTDKIYFGNVAQANTPVEFGLTTNPYASFGGNASIGQISTNTLGVGTGASGSTAGTIVTANVLAGGLNVTGSANVTGVVSSKVNGDIAFSANASTPVGFGRNGSLGSMQLFGGDASAIDGNAAASVSGTYVSTRRDSIFGWSIAAANAATTLDTGLSRSAAGVVAVGTGAVGSTAGAIVAASYWTAVPNTVTSASYTVPATASYIVTNVAGTTTVTLPAASSSAGRNINIRTITANTVVSASSNVVPVAGGAAGTAILAATAGKWARLVSDGVNWNIEMSN